jgi:AcrR family transcriptional regulator
VTSVGEHSPARSRLLETASRLFYTEGLHSVGIDRIVAEAHVTRATLYRHFPSKNQLVIAYLSEVDNAVRAQLAKAAAREKSSADVLRAIGESIAADITAPGFRGCAFLNAAAEYPDPAHPVHRTVLIHREWFLRTITDLLTHAHATAPDPTARHFIMLRDGAMAAGSLTDPKPIGRTLLRGIDGLLKYRNAHATPQATESEGAPHA